MSGDPEQAYFADGMTDDLITDLSKVKGLFVIARNSVFIYRDRAVEVRQVAEDLGVRYVLEGSVRRAGDQVRVNAQLVDATTGGPVWANRYDGDVTDIFAVQDGFVREIVAALTLKLSDGEKVEIASGQTANVDALAAFQKGWAHYLRYTPANNAKAAQLFKQATELDPGYGRAYSALGLVYVRGCQWRWHEELGVTTGAAFDIAADYLEKAKINTSSLTNVAASQLYLYDNKHNQAYAEAARAVALDSNDPEAQLAMGLAMTTTGKPKAGLVFIETALRLNPSHPSHYVLARAMAFFSMDDMGRAAAALAAALELNPGALELAPLLAASYARLGRRQDARTALLLRQPGANQSELELFVFNYHFPYKWAESDRVIKGWLDDGLWVAALPLDITVASLAATLQKIEGADRIALVREIGQFGPAAGEAVPALINALADQNRWVRVNALKVLGQIGPAAAAAIPTLEAMRDDKNEGAFANKAIESIRGN